jgi:hypothetical protein
MEPLIVRFRGRRDYTEAFSEAVRELVALEIKDRTERIQAIDDLLDSYVEATGRRPHSSDLFRLSNHILREELADKRKHKSKKTEFPILGRKAIERRQEQEASLNSFDELYDTNGKNKGFPKRRERSSYEQMNTNCRLAE